MARFRRFWPLLFVAAALCGAIWGAWSSARAPRIDQHTAANYENNRNPNPKDKGSITLIAWASANHDAIEAISALGSFVFAGVLGISTLMLWRATRKAAKAGRDSADIARRALTELEQPFLVFSVKNTGLFVDIRGVVSPNEFLVSHFENIGRTPAVLIEHCDNVLVVERKQCWPTPIDPNAPVVGLAHHTTFPVGMAVGAQLNYTVKENMIRKPLEDPHWSGFAKSSGNRDHLFVYGFIRYRDIFGSRYIMGYCSIFDVIRNRFVPMGDTKYNYFRKEEEITGLSQPAPNLPVS